MKKNLLKRSLTVAVSGAMVMGTLAGCGSTEDVSSDKTTAEGASTEAAAESTEAASDAGTTEVAAGAGMDAWEPFAENVTIKIPVYDRGVEGVPDVTDNYWTKWVNENFGSAYNVTVEYVPITRSDVLTSYSLLAASDDLPTICMEYDYPKMTQWANDGYLQTYDVDQLAEIAPTYYQNMVDNNLMQFTNLGDETYFTMGTRPYATTTYSFCTFYRRDWLKQLGVDEYPTTWEGMKDLCQKIVDAGLAEHPLGGSQVTGAGVDQNYAYRTYPQDELLWATTGDYNIPALSTDAQKTLLKRENEAFNLGYKDPEYYITDAETAKAAFVNGETLSYSGYMSSNVDWLTAFYETNPDADLDMVVCDGVTEDNDATGYSCSGYRPNNLFGMMAGFSSSATEDEVKAAMMYMEWMTQPDNLFTMTWGVEGENYTVGDDGNPVSVADYDGDSKQGYNNNIDYWCITTASKSFGSIEEDVAAIAPQGLPEDFTQDMIDNYNGQLKVYDAGYAQMDCLFQVAISAEADNAADLATKYEEFRNELTMCSTDEFDAMYDKLSQEYLDAGYQDVIDERQAAYEAGSCTKLAQ